MTVLQSRSGGPPRAGRIGYKHVDGDAQTRIGSIDAQAERGKVQIGRWSGRVAG
jgi:hypothetical protein